MFSEGNMNVLRNKRAGFTLIEVLVALAMVGIVSIALLNIFISNQRVYLDQDEVVAAQQNLRAGFDIMVQEIRMAGFTGDEDAAAGIITAGSDNIVFTMDFYDDSSNSIPDGDVSDTNEYITYSLYTSGGVSNLGRKSTNGGTNVPIAEGIVGLGFAYAIDADGDDVLDTDGGNTIWAVASGGNWFDLDTNDDGAITAADDTDNSGVLDGNDTGIAVDVADIRAVRVWLLAETLHDSQSFSETASFVVGENVITPGDNKRHRLLSTIIKCRNLGL